MSQANKHRDIPGSGGSRPPFGCILKLDTNVSIDNLTKTEVTWQSAVIDSDVLWNGAKEIIIKTLAKYELVCQIFGVVGLNPADDVGWIIEILLNGGIIASGSMGHATTGIPDEGGNVATSRILSPADVLKVQVWHNMGVGSGTLEGVTDPFVKTYFAVMPIARSN